MAASHLLPLTKTSNRVDTIVYENINVSYNQEENEGAHYLLGLISLLCDAFYVNMSLTIMTGLGFATLMTLLLVPMLYAVLFRDKSRLLQISI
jgi:hypothetical protein